MDRGVKRAIERFFRDEIWIDKVSRIKDVTELIDKLKPVSPRAPLRRVGPAGDGGYLLPDDLEGIVACVSPGVSEECGFDEELAQRDIDILMADASVPGPPKDHPRFHFEPKFIDIMPSDGTMTLEELSSLSERSKGGGDLILQMDIEGAEYRVLAAAPDQLLQRFRIMVIEFHQLDRVFSRQGIELIKPMFEKLTATHNVVHIHPNNCMRPIRRGGLTVPPVMEFTFYRKDRPLAPDAERVYPHPLDADCAPSRPPIVLPQCWQ